MCTYLTYGAAARLKHSTSQIRSHIEYSERTSDTIVVSF